MKTVHSILGWVIAISIAMTYVAPSVYDSIARHSGEGTWHEARAISERLAYLEEDRRRTADELSRLRQTLTEMHMEIVGLHRDAAANSSTPRTRNSEAMADRVVDPVTAKLEEEFQERDRREKLNKDFLDEPPDMEWAGTTVNLLQETLEDVLPQQRELIKGLDCRSRTCRIEVSGDSHHAFDKAWPSVASRVASVLPSMSATEGFDESGNPTRIFYLSRDVDTE